MELCFSKLSTSPFQFSNPHLHFHASKTEVTFCKWPNSLPYLLSALSGSERVTFTPISPSAFLILVSSPQLLSSPHLLYHSYLESYGPFSHLLLPLCSSLTWFFQWPSHPLDCLRCIRYATLVVQLLREWVGCALHESRAQVSSLLLPEPHGDPENAVVS